MVPQRSTIIVSAFSLLTAVSHVVAPQNGLCKGSLETTLAMLESEHFTLRRRVTQHDSADATIISDHRNSVAIDELMSNINCRFSDAAVKLLVSSSVFNLALIPTEEAVLPEYGNDI